MRRQETGSGRRRQAGQGGVEGEVVAGGAEARDPGDADLSKNCTRDGRISIRVTGGTVKTVKLVRGKRTKTLKFKRVSGRLQLSGIPKSSKTKLRFSVRVKGGRVVKVDKTYKPCKG